VNAHEPWEGGPPPGRFDDDAPTVAPYANGTGGATGDEPPSGGAADEDAPPRVIEHVGADAIFAPVPPPEWICEGLRLAHGCGVACFGGYGYSGKTVIAQSIALSVATGSDVFGVFRATRGRVLHLDYEQGSRVTRERYQRLARAMGASLEDVGDRLRLAVFPSVYLDDRDAADVFARTLEGFDLVIVDAIRGAAPTLEENSSEVRRVIDLLGRESERTGALPLALAHARKPTPAGKGGDSPSGEAKFSLRGSSAIFDALSQLFVLGGAKGEAVRVEHEKDRIYGVPLADFGVRVEDVEGAHAANGPIDRRWGLRVVHLDREQLDKAPTSTGSALAKHAERIVAYLAANGGKYEGNKGALCKSIGMNRTAFFEALSTLEGTKVRVQAATTRTGPQVGLIPVVKP
jgi:hypothetical protein